jgi:hypothetical protein
LFNRKDIEGARDFWSPGYIQHNPLFADGRGGLQVRKFIAIIDPA